MPRNRILLPALALAVVSAAGCVSTPTEPAQTVHVSFDALESSTIMFLRADRGSSDAVIARGAYQLATRVKLVGAMSNGSAAIAPGGQVIAYTAYIGEYAPRRIHIADASGMYRHVLDSPGTGAPVWRLLGSEVIAPIVEPKGKMLGFHAHAVELSTYFNGQGTTFSASSNSRMLFPFGSEEVCPRITSPEARIDVHELRFAMVCDATEHDELDILTHVGTMAAVYRPPAGPNVPPRLYSPSFSPDGSEVAFLEVSRNKSGNPTKMAVRIVGADGTG